MNIPLRLVGAYGGLAWICATLAITGCASPVLQSDGEQAVNRSVPASPLEISMDDLEWFPMETPLKMPGAKFAILKGDLGKPGPFAIAGYYPPNYKFPAHWHDADEEITVLAGSIYMGGEDGKPIDKVSGALYKKGDKHLLPKGHVHWLLTTDESAVIKVSSPGPFGMHWVEQ